MAILLRVPLPMPNTHILSWLGRRSAHIRARVVDAYGEVPDDPVLFSFWLCAFAFGQGVFSPCTRVCCMNLVLCELVPTDGFVSLLSTAFGLWYVNAILFFVLCMPARLPESRKSTRDALDAAADCSRSHASFASLRAFPPTQPRLSSCWRRNPCTSACTS